MKQTRRSYLIALGIVILLFLLLLVLLGMQLQATILGLLLVVALSLFFILRQYRSIIALKHAYKQAELQHLQNQVNPHFLFNSMNAVYGLVELDPAKAKDLLLKISELMRYNVYESSKPRVLLSNEVAFLRNYFELNRIRYNRNLDLKFDVDIDSTNYEILPLLCINLVENAIKHGVEKLQKDAFVHVTLKVENGKMSLVVRNNHDPDHTGTAGIGLENLKKRLQLTYQGQHELSLESNGNIHLAQLILQL
ncbi:MAG: histidine kinase [Bacteroidota bacterium]